MIGGTTYPTHVIRVIDNEILPLIFKAQARLAALRDESCEANMAEGYYRLPESAQHDAYLRLFMLGGNSSPGQRVENLLDATEAMTWKLRADARYIECRYEGEEVS